MIYTSSKRSLPGRSPQFVEGKSARSRSIVTPRLASRTSIAGAASSGSTATAPAILGLEAAILSDAAAVGGPAPTITLGQPNGGSQIAHGVDVNAIVHPDPKAGILSTDYFRYLGMAPGAAGGGFTGFVGSINVTNLAPGAAMGLIVEFEFDGSEFELIEAANDDVSTSGSTIGMYRLTIDGVPVSDMPTPTEVFAGPTYRRLVSFDGVRAQRRIRVEYGNAYFAGVTIGPSDTIYKPFTPVGARCIVLGDSYTYGKAADAWFTGYAPQLGQIMGWDLWPSGVRATGYLNPSKHILKQPFASRVQHDVIGYDPEFVIVAGGINDAKYHESAVNAAAVSLFRTLIANLPNSTIIVLGPWQPRPLPLIEEAIKSAAATCDLPFIPTTGWFRGKGTISKPSPAGGNANYYIWDDDVHPTQAGHTYLARKLAGEIMLALNDQL
jgi:lysophospholipase L1-like esterase